MIETGACVLISRSKYEKEKEKVQTVKCNKAQIIEQTWSLILWLAFFFFTVLKKEVGLYYIWYLFWKKNSKEGIAITGLEIIWLTGIHPDEVGKRERNSEWRGNGRLWMEEDFILQSRLGKYKGKNWARQKSYGRDMTFWWCLIVCCLLWRYGADEQCKCILKHHN